MTTENGGFNLVELCVIIIIVMILAGMLIPALGIDREGARKAACGNNQRQIILACLVYPADQDSVWPVFTANEAGQWVSATDPTVHPMATAIASLEFVAAVTGGDLQSKVFSCPSKPHARPTTPAALRNERSATSAWANAGAEHVGYAYDWSVPSNASHVRVVTADRDRAAHRSRAVMAGFADGHVGSLARSGILANAAVVFLNRQAGQDDIYNDLGDGPMNTPNEGSTTRAFVR